MSTLSQRITETSQGSEIWHQERVIFEATERICELMEEQGVTRTQLAAELGKSKGYITQLLDGSANMTLRTLSDTFLALGREFHVHDTPITLDDDFSTVVRCVFESENLWSSSDDRIEAYPPQLKVEVA